MPYFLPTLLSRAWRRGHLDAVSKRPRRTVPTGSLSSPHCWRTVFVNMRNSMACPPWLRGKARI